MQKADTYWVAVESKELEAHTTDGTTDSGSQTTQGSSTTAVCTFIIGLAGILATFAR